jgi:hypothetical protein
MINIANMLLMFSKNTTLARIQRSITIAGEKKEKELTLLL